MSGDHVKLKATLHVGSVAEVMREAVQHLLRPDAAHSPTIADLSPHICCESNIGVAHCFDRDYVIRLKRPIEYSQRRAMVSFSSINAVEALVQSSF